MDHVQLDLTVMACTLPSASVGDLAKKERGRVARPKIGVQIRTWSSAARGIEVTIGHKNPSDGHNIAKERQLCTELPDFASRPGVSTGRLHGCNFTTGMCQQVCKIP